MRAAPASRFVAGLAAAGLAWAGVAHWLAVVLPFTVFLFGTALVIPNATATALSPFPGMAGTVSSLLGAMSFAGGALLSTLLGAAFDGTARPMASAAALTGIPRLPLRKAARAWKSLTQWWSARVSSAWRWRAPSPWPGAKW